MVKVLVTGGAGFIGSNLVDALLDAGHEVTVFDNFSTGSRDNLKAAADAARGSFRTLPPVHIVTGSVTWLPDVTRVMEDFRPEVVYHLAAQVDVGTSAEYPTIDAATNVGGTVNVLEAAKRAGVRRFVFVSSAAIFGNAPVPTSYGGGGYVDWREEPISPYGASKAAAGAYVDLYDRMGANGHHNMVCSTVVFSNVYGPRQAPGRGAVNIFARALLRGEPVTLHGDGQNIRDYLYVGDAVRALQWAGGCLGGGEPGGLPGGRMLVGTGVGTTDDALLAAVTTEVARQATPVPVHRPAARGPAGVSDVRSSVFPRSELARTPLADGLRVTVEAIRKELGL